MAKILNVGIIGYGISTKTFHLPLVTATENLKLAAISTSKPENIPTELADVTIYPHYEDIIHHTDLDLIIIPTPNHTHYPLAKAALLAGKHVVIDKPFTITPEEARELSAIAKDKQLILTVFHNRRWDGDFLTVKHLIENNVLGEIKYIESHFDRHIPTIRSNWRETDIPGNGTWYDLGAHTIDQILQLFGMPDELSVDCAKLREDAVAVDFFHTLMKYPTKRVVLHSTMIGADPSPRFIVHGTEGSYTIYGMDPQSEQLKAGMSPLDPNFGVYNVDGRLTRIIDGQPVSSTYKTVKGQYNTFYAAVRDAITGTGENPVSTDSACQVMEIIFNYA